MNRGLEVDLDTGLEIERLQFAGTFATEDRTEGMRRLRGQGEAGLHRTLSASAPARARAHPVGHRPHRSYRPYSPARGSREAREAYGMEQLPEAARARMAEIRASGTWGSALTADEFAAIRSVGFEPVGQVLGACVYNIGYTGGYACPGAWGHRG